MSTELAIYDRIQNPIDAVKQFGLAIHQSGMFGTAAPQQGEVLAMECLARRMPPLMLAERYHIIQGKLSMKADATLAAFLEAGGKHQLIERSPQRAAIKLTVGDQSQEFSLTWDEAKEEPFVYEGREKETLKKLGNGRNGLEVKAKYQTPRSRMQMLWARVVSDGVRTMLPTVNCGVYSPEEVEDFDGESAKNSAKKTEPAPAAETTDVVDVPFDEVSESAPTQEPAAQSANSASCTAEQSARLKQLWGLLEVSVEDRARQLAKRGCKVARSLTAEQASGLIHKLESLYFARQADEGLCPPELANQVKVRLQEIEQQQPGTIKKVTAKVNAAGYAKLIELRQGDVRKLLEALTGSDIEAFFGVSLWPTPKGGEAKN